jgi:hypothetical protein
VLINPDNARAVLQMASLVMTPEKRLQLGTVLRELSEDLILQANAELEVQNQDPHPGARNRW